ncbi:MAG: serine hydrolase [bacterium]|nr:serine hydrolase [bacterium]
MNKTVTIVITAALLISACAGAAYSLFRPINVYKPDAEALEIPQMKRKAYLDNGWYANPVRIMYNPDGSTICIDEAETDNYINQGWFTETPLIIYAPDGRTMYINESEREAYEAVGWYTEAVTLMYATDGRTMYVKNSEVDDYLQVGWYLERPDHEGLTELKTRLAEYIENRPGEWGLYVHRLSDNEYLSINEKSYSAASLIKLFTMAAVYNELECGSFENSEEIDSMLEQMITESSNKACNSLTKRLGSGNTVHGFEVENKNTKSLGCENTSHGSELIDESGQYAIFVGYNRTSPRDCGRLLKEIYNGTLVSEQASESMLNLLKQQTRTWKIPAALPDEAVTANKTGETDTVEADAAIVYSPGADFIICAIGNGNIDGGIETIQTSAKIAYNYFNP